MYRGNSFYIINMIPAISAMSPMTLEINDIILMRLRADCHRIVEIAKSVRG